MPKTRKQTGYIVNLEWFVPADISDNEHLAVLQKSVKDIKSQYPNCVGSITPTRR